MLRRAQVLIEVGNESAVEVFSGGWATNRETHALLMHPLALQVEYGFMLSLNWVPTAQNGVAEAISLPSREAIIRIAPVYFHSNIGRMGPFNVDVMCAASVLQSQVSDEVLPFLFLLRLHRLYRNGCFCAGCVHHTNYYGFIL